MDQNVEFSLRLGASPAEIFREEDGEPTLTQLFKGISLGIRVNVWRKISDVLFNIVEAGEVDSSMLPFFGGIAPALMLRINGNLNITVDKPMMAKLEEHPLLAPLVMSPA